MGNELGKWVGLVVIDELDCRIYRAEHVFLGHFGRGGYGKHTKYRQEADIDIDVGGVGGGAVPFAGIR